MISLVVFLIAVSRLHLTLANAQALHVLFIFRLAIVCCAAEISCRLILVEFQVVIGLVEGKDFSLF
jgi:hypothetical protein